MNKIAVASAICFMILTTEAAAQRRIAPPAPPLSGRPFPPSLKIEGRPNELRPPEKPDDKPAFPEQTRAPYHASVAVTAIVVTDKLERPWAVAPLPDGGFLVTEKAGTMRVVSKDGVVSKEIVGVPEVEAAGQGGLLDVVLDRNFAATRRVFFTFTQPRGPGLSGIVVARATLDEAGLALNDVKIIFAVEPAVTITQSSQQGGRIAVASDGTLFVTVGDRSTRGPWPKAQDMTTTLGKVIHITEDGKPSSDNPFLGNANVAPEIWSSGHRNAQGITFDSSGLLWQVEHGPMGGDELNDIRPGKNYGWPVIVRGIDYSGLEIGDGSTEKPGMEQPLYYWDPVIAPGGLAVYSGKLFPQWNGNLLVAALRGAQIARLTLTKGKVVSEEPILGDTIGRVRDVRVGGDGSVIALTESGSLLRIVPGSSLN